MLLTPMNRLPLIQGYDRRKFRRKAEKQKAPKKHTTGKRARDRVMSQRDTRRRREKEQ
jgi:hypothetical protein